MKRKLVLECSKAETRRIKYGKLTENQMAATVVVRLRKLGHKNVPRR